LFEKLRTDAIVLTSANFSDEPLIIDNEKSVESFNGKVDGILLYNRAIYNRVDDSVCMVVNDKPRLIRRSRGFVPLSVNIMFPVEGILATGAELTNCFCLGKGHEAIMSQHIGDLKNMETYDFFTDSIERFKRLYRVKPKLIVHDLHPDYLSTRYALDQEIETMAVQHHHAHIGSCMAEHGLDEKVIGVAFDGTGYGIDGNIWGGEFLIADLKDFERAFHFEYVPMPGGDKVVEEPWRMAVAFLLNAYGSFEVIPRLPFMQKVKNEELRVILEMIEKGINSPLTSSVGRLFDAVSAMLNVCIYASYHAEAPMRLEDIINENEHGIYNYEINHELKIISFAQAIRQIVEEITKSIDPSIISTRFHNTIVQVIVDICEQVRKETGLNKVVLSGGSFQNRYLLYHAEKSLIQNGFNVYSNCSFPSNDGGIALGQLAIGGKRMSVRK
jgi:hydrogenase maturation protein HypF